MSSYGWKSLARVALIVVAGAGCAADGTTAVGDSPATLMDLDGSPARWADGDWTLLDGAIHGDTLDVELRYSGGCALHDFWLVAVPGWIDIPAADSTPTVAVALRIAHDDHGDRCEAALVQSLQVDLRPLRDAYYADRGPGPARIILRLPVGQGALDTVDLEWTIDGSGDL